MDNLPKWWKEHYPDGSYKCPQCDARFKEEGIYGCGIKEAHQEPERKVLFVEYACSACGQKTTIELKTMGLFELASSILESIEDSLSEENVEKKETKKKEPEYYTGGPKAKKRTVSRITKEEQKSVSKKLSVIKDWNEWLEFIGADVLDDGKEDFTIHEED